MKLKIDLQKNILITGSEGFVGSYFYKKLKKYNNIFYCDLKKIEKKNYFICDVKNKLQLEKLVTENKIKIIVHLASEIFDNSDEKIFNNNIMMGKSIFEIAKRIKLDKEFRFYEQFYKKLSKTINVLDLTNDFLEYSKTDDLYEDDKYASHLSVKGNKLVSKTLKKYIQNDK
jgi:F0F1-type ATP synthase gamma subunit